MGIASLGVNLSLLSLLLFVLCGLVQGSNPQQHHHLSPASSHQQPSPRLIGNYQYRHSA
ncbi:hypothetical protein K440DRAFT_609516 [Wilcoxina mikolae CBS 423.85]|nr:hypothetical protein K440DRAFT_609516 [Wilcoxina mikolae CBS 423.85]